MVDSYLVSFAGLLLTLGTLGDRFGRKRALQAGIALFGLSSLAVLFVETSTQLIAVRALMGVGAAMIMPATLSIITNVFPREERAKAIGIWAGTAAIGVGLGPLIGGLLLEYFDWYSVFLVNVPVALVAFLAGMRLVPESRDPDPGRFDVPGALLSVGALVSLIYALIEAPDTGWLDPTILGAFGLALALGAAFVAWELRTAAPMLDLSLFRNPRFSIGSLSMGLAFFSLFGAIFALTQFLQFAKDYSPLEAGAAMVPLAFGLMLGSTRSVKLAERVGTTRVVAAGLLGLGAAAVHLAPGMVMGHDTLDHAWGAWSYLQSWHAGDWLPIWLHQVGLGQPMPLFYGPLPFWAMAPFAIAGGATSWMLSAGAERSSRRSQWPGLPIASSIRITGSGSARPGA
jgi:MFS family permease